MNPPPEASALGTLYAEMLSEPSGTFSMRHFLITSTLPHYDFRPIGEAVRTSGYDAANQIAFKQFEDSADKVGYVYEYTIPLHEKRHFFDLISTPFGLHLFSLNWSLTVAFQHLLEQLGQSGVPVCLPWRAWQKQGCPEPVSAFLRLYDGVQQELRQRLNGASPLRLPATDFQVDYDVALLRLKDETDEKPYVALREGSEFGVYPVSGRAVMESLAWITQLAVIRMFDERLFETWKERIRSKRGLWHYHAMLTLTTACTHDNLDDAVKMLEFALMTPIRAVTDAEFAETFEETDVGWRLYRLATELLHNGSADLDGAIEAVCKTEGWRTPDEVMEVTRRYLDESGSEQGMPNPQDPFLSVLYEYSQIFKTAVNFRQNHALLGLFRFARLATPLPPLHRVVLSNGEVEVRVSPDSGLSWVHFMAINELLVQAVENETLHCPIGYKSQAELKQGCKCTCELRLEDCPIADVLTRLGVTSLISSRTGT